MRMVIIFGLLSFNRRFYRVLRIRDLGSVSSRVSAVHIVFEGC